MKQRFESIFALSIVCFSLIYLFFVWKMDIGTLTDPGPGFMPAVVGSMALGASLVIFIGSVKHLALHRTAKGPRDGIWRFAGSFCAIVIFIPLFQALGAVISIGIVVFSLNKILGAQGWLRPALLAVTCSITVYVLFVMLLDVPLPRGIL